tara:strand:+ start:141 stop:374 length:234 start_codon:yes stop_codon:yes gene_type:complete
MTETNKNVKDYLDLNTICKRKNIYPEQKFIITNVTPTQNEENNDDIVITLSPLVEYTTNETIPISLEDFQKEYEVLK